jgi:sn-glycerol 3-phosphate transport system permease protein
MYVIQPIVIFVLAVVIGAAALGYLFYRPPFHKPLWGAVGGSLAGAFGSLLFMLPLNFCTFESERTGIDVAAGLLLIALGILLAGWVVKRILISRLTHQRLLPSGDYMPGTFKGRWSGWIAFLFLLPTLIILILFNYIPMGQTFQYATLLARFGTVKTKFVCLNNFTSLVSDQGYLRSMALSFILTGGMVVVGLSVSLLIAQMAYQPLKGARVYRSLLVWPYALSPVIVGTIFQLLLNPHAGVINHLFGVDINWLLDPGIAPLTVILAAVWNILGFNILFYIAGLQNISKDLLEAASIDGANAWQRFSNITLPLLSPFTFFLVVTNTIYAFFETFGLIHVMTNGGPIGATTTSMYGVYLLGILGKDLGRSAAQSLILLLVVIGVTAFQFRASRKYVTYGT